ASPDDGRPGMSAGLMRRVLVYCKRLDIPVMVHEEDLTLSAGGALTEGPRATRLGLLPLPRSAEVAMVARDLVLLAETGGRLHVAPPPLAERAPLVRPAHPPRLPAPPTPPPPHPTPPPPP